MYLERLYYTSGVDKAVELFRVVFVMTRDVAR